MIRIAELEKSHRQLLENIRHFGNLEAAEDDVSLWLRGFTDVQWESVAWRSIPWKRKYGLQNGLLIPEGARLPVKKLPDDIHWKTIREALPLERPDYNNNFFGLSGNQKVTFKLVRTEQPQEEAALLTKLEHLASYAENASATRFEGLEWVVIDHQYALLIGTPLLPLSGKSYWQKGMHLFPSGLVPELPGLLPFLKEVLKPEEGMRMLWSEDGELCPLYVTNFESLSRASIRKTIVRLNRSSLDFA